MKRIASILSILLLTAGAWSLYAQVEGDDKKDEKKKKKEYRVPVYLGETSYRDTAIPQETFDSLLRQGLTAKDSAGISYDVQGFLFTFGERNLYEDSVGNLMWVTDLLSEYCYGDTMSSWLLSTITSRTKKGDTIYIDQIKVSSPEGKPFNGKWMKFVLTK